MSIDIKTATIEPLRTTFDHLAARLGPGKTPTRYQEGVFDLQMTQNFHYRPTWQPEFELFDPRRTAIRLEDYDQLLDPRQYYYSPYTLQRARQQDAQDASFTLVEKRRLFAALAPEVLTSIRALIVPLRHYEWGANTNNCYISAYGYGAPMTSAAMLQAMDRLGIAQYLTRLALTIDDNDPAPLDAAKQAWLDAPHWQPLRHLIEDAMVLSDWFELHVLQNFVLDGFVHPFAFQHFDARLSAQGGVAYGLLTEFMREWYAESVRWTDATIKVAVAANAGNQALIGDWIGRWLPRARAAVAPLAALGLGAADGEAALDTMCGELAARQRKLGLAA